MRTMLAAMAMLLMTAPALAQDAKPQPRMNADSMMVDMVKFKPGTTARLAEIEKMFSQANKAANIPDPMVVHFQTGPWDAVYIFTLPGGFADLGYVRSPTDVAFMNALAGVAGGKDKAEALLKEWDAAIENRVSNIGHHHK